MDIGNSMKGNEDEWGPRMDNKLLSGEDMTMGSPDTGKIYDDNNKMVELVKSTINSLHIEPEDLHDSKYVETCARAVAYTISKKYGIQDTDPSFNDIYSKAKNILVDMEYKYHAENASKNADAEYEKRVEEEERRKGNNFAKPEKPANMKETANKVNDDRVNVGRFFGNVWDKITGM